MDPRAVVDIDLGYRRLVRQIRGFARASVTIGYHEGDRTRFQDKNGRIKNGGESMAAIAAMNEFGTARIPMRSFIRSGWDRNFQRIERLVEFEVGRVVDNRNNLTQALGRIGQVVTSIIKLRIDQIFTPPNSPLTIRLKGSSKPLIDTGQMKASVRYVYRL